MYLGTRHKVFTFFRTAIVFIIIVLLLLWVHFRTPIPPYPEGGGGPGMGIEINLGTSDVGMDNNQQQAPVEMPDFKSSPSTPSGGEKILTQDEEETGSIEPSEKKEMPLKEHKKKNIKKIKVETPPKEIKNEEVKEEPKINPNAMFPPKKNKGNEGITGKPGDQGNQNGIAGSPIYSGNGNGSGGGSGGGTGTGTGTDKGNGVSFSLEGRNVLYLQKPEYNYQSAGIVVVAITVDKTGTVTNAVPGAKGGTTLDDYLLQVARKAALQSKFTPKPDASIQKGTITYHFVLQ